MMEMAPAASIAPPQPEAFTMRTFTPPATTRFYAGLDLHARAAFLVLLDHEGRTVFAQNLPAQPDAFLCAAARRVAVGPEPRLPRIASRVAASPPSPRLLSPRSRRQQSVLVPGKGNACLLTSRAL